jgi:hypothetical protein
MEMELGLECGMQVSENKVLRRIFALKRDRMGWYGLDQFGSGQGPVEGSCERGNEPLGSIICWEVLE